MRRSVFLLAVLALGGCTISHGRWTEQRYEGPKHPYGVYIGRDGLALMVGEDWRLDNYTAARGAVGWYDRGKPRAAVSAGDPKSLRAKEGPDYLVHRKYDVDENGSVDVDRDEPFYDLLFEHTRRDAELYVRTVPVSTSDADKDLDVMAARYVEAASGAGSVPVRFGSDGPLGSVEKRFASRVHGMVSCQVSGKPAIVVDYEIANVDQLQLSSDTRWLRTRLAIVRTGYDEELGAGAARARFPILMLVGLSTAPSDFDALAPAFDKLLGQIALGDQPGAIPDKGGHTCSAPAPSAPAAAEPAPATPVPAAAPEPESSPVDPGPEPHT